MDGIYHHVGGAETDFGRLILHNFPSRCCFQRSSSSVCLEVPRRYNRSKSEVTVHPPQRDHRTLTEVDSESANLSRSVTPPQFPRTPPEMVALSTITETWMGNLGDEPSISAPNPFSPTVGSWVSALAYRCVMMLFP